MPKDLQREINLPHGPNAFIPMRDFIVRCLEQAELEAPARRAIMVGLDEALRASLLGDDSHGRAGQLTLLVDVNPTRLMVRLKDDSEGAELQENPIEGLLQSASRSRRELGLDILRRVMDEVHYTYRRGFQNELELIKFL